MARAKKKNTPTLEDVARTAGVSTATISRAINEPEKVASATLERIQSVIDELGYTPNFGGKILASNRSNTVGAIIPTMANAVFASGVQAFQQELSRAGVILLVSSTGYSAENELKQIRSLMAHGADGLLLIGASRPRETTDFLALRKVPYVVSWYYDSDPSQVFAGFDNYKAAQMMTSHVLEMGHRRIAMVAGLSQDNDRAGNRIKGVRDTIECFGNDARLTEVIETGYSLDSGGAAFHRVMDVKNPPTAVICGHDVLAAGAVLRARELGIAVPKQVSITGFDDISLASVLYPALTTVRVPQIEMGQAAAKLLLEMLSSEAKPDSIELETEIIMRDSLAPPGKDGK